MKFNTGDVAEFMGITNMGVIYLEKKGVISAERERNGYRTFDMDTITQLGLIRGFERLGFSLEEAVELSRKDAASAQQSLERKKRELQKTLATIAMMEERMSHAVIDGEVTDENAEIVTAPAMLYCPIWEEKYAMDSLPRARQQMMRDVDVSWIAAMPYMHYCSKLTPSDSGWQAERGNCILTEHAQSERVLTNELIERVPERRCLRYFDQSGSAVQAAEKGLRYLRGKGIACEGTIFAPIMSLAREQNGWRGRTCILLPLAAE